MDIFAHGIWTGVSYEALKRNSKRPINVKLAVFWGIFPDLFAFTAPFVFMTWEVLFNGASVTQFRPPADLEPTAHHFPMYDLAHSLYNVSHSMFIFALIFVVVALFRRRAMWEMGGWLLHILIDIPTHSYKFFPTPFLWPVSDLRVNGFSWGNPAFMAINYTLIVISLYSLWYTGRRKKKS